ncbi:MAG: sirohydrochlorin cobaltochelatase, partial [Desulforhabdus sp.]|nr:sirohydrochlorin cobaltochelatase [Desulforhabdus sp.]
MRKVVHVAVIVVLLGLFGLNNAFAIHGKEHPKKKAILLVAFGTSVPEAQKVYEKIDEKVRQAFSGEEVRWGYTSDIIRSKLAKEGKSIDSPELALAKLMEENYTHVAVLSLHTIPGAEFHDLNRNAKLYGQMAGGFERILVAWPLLSSHEDMVKVAERIIKHLPAERKPEEVVLLMGHGTEHHPADAVYAAMNQVFQGMDSNVLVATVEGYPALNDLLPQIEKSGAQ